MDWYRIEFVEGKLATYINSVGRDGWTTYVGELWGVQ